MLFPELPLYYLPATMNGWSTTATPMTKGANDSVYTVLVDSLNPEAYNNLNLFMEVGYPGKVLLNLL